MPAEARRKHPARLSYEVFNKVEAKLSREAIEDFRIDFEDGYGNRSNEEEDECAVTAAREVAQGMKDKTLPPFIGIRIKPMSKELHARSLRTLDIFIKTLVKSAKRLPDNFALTLTKVMAPAHVTEVETELEQLRRSIDRL